MKEELFNNETKRKAGQQGKEESQLYINDSPGSWACMMQRTSMTLVVSVC